MYFRGKGPGYGFELEGISGVVLTWPPKIDTDYKRKQSLAWSGGGGNLILSGLTAIRVAYHPGQRPVALGTWIKYGQCYGLHPEFESKMIEFIRQGNMNLVLDFSEVDLIDSSGLGPWLL